MTNKKCAKCDITNGDPWKPTGTDCDAGKHQWVEIKNEAHSKCGSCPATFSKDMIHQCGSANPTIKESLQAGKGDDRPWWMDRLRSILFESIYIRGEDGLPDRSKEGMLSVDVSNIESFIQETVSESLRMAAERILVKKKTGQNGEGLPSENSPDIYGNARMEAYKKGYNDAIGDAESIIKGGTLTQ